MADNRDDFLRKLEADKARGAARPETDEQALQQQREEKVAGFKLDIQFDEADRSAPPPRAAEPPRPAAAPARGGMHRSDPPERPVEMLRTMPQPPQPQEAGEPAGDAAEDLRRRKRAKKIKRHVKTVANWTLACIYVVLVLGISSFLIYFGITGALDFIGFKNDNTPIYVVLTEEQSKDINLIAEVLAEKNVIDQPFIFKLYCRIAKPESFRANQEFELNRDMNYQGIINAMRTVVRETVKVTFPEGYTVENFADKLEESDVCTREDFLTALNTAEFDFPFLNDIPDGADYRYRYQKYEGFLFPDTYEFYLGMTGEDVANKIFREGFNSRITLDMRIRMQNEGLESVYDTIILASIIEWEATTLEMRGVSRVIYNRLAPTNSETNGKLECDSTYRYLDTFVDKINGERDSGSPYFLVYNTYEITGLPIAPICNPGLDAIDAAMNPSNESEHTNKYYFATNTSTGDTYYSRTFKEHEAICKLYKIGAYGDN